ncbi:MAG: HDOD domain-containing protein [Rubrivivax sp.]|nr:HDOD domain-containing protein [Rubrivivax sp.]MDP3615909.1 HDOD domain-containing protein [Rubrivivax sp.]
MFDWLKRLGGVRAVTPTGAPKPSVQAATAASKPNGRAAPPEPAAPAPGAPQAQPGLRRALLGRNGHVAGFELLLPEAVSGRLRVKPEVGAAVAHHLALLASASLQVTALRPVLITLPADVQREAVLAAVPAHAWVWPGPGTAVPDDRLLALRERGVRVGAADGPPLRSPALDFLVLQAAAGGVDTLLLSAQRWREQQPKLALVALDLPNLDEMERVLRAGFVLVGGQFGRSARQLPARPLGTAAHRVCELMNHLALDHDTAVIGQAVAADVSLTYRLLRYANSPAIGLNRGVETVDQAVMVLGRAELGRWLSVMLLSAAESRQAGRALQEAALARGRLLERVAAQLAVPDPGAFFTMGLLSLIEQLLQLPMAAALAPLRLSEPVLDALLRRQGPWAPMLDLLDALDGADTLHIEQACQALGLQGPLAQWQEEAWRWAGEVSAGAA